jgi:cation diffusion facilitator CzcD-associated flavoprotein CzcO
MTATIAAGPRRVDDPSGCRRHVDTLAAHVHRAPRRPHHRRRPVRHRAAHHLRERHPGRTVALLEARDDLGGTWDLFRYPGIRSDSDMHTLGFGFRPWREARAIADGPSILRYLRETAEADGTDELIRYGHRVVRAAWSSSRARWTVDVEEAATGEERQLTCGFLLGCTGYYRYDEGYTPHFAGRERFAGPVIHPQHWPEDLAYDGRRVVVIGSGATAVTLVPALAERAGHVTMLQRSPTWITSLPSVDPVAEQARRVLPERLAFPPCAGRTSCSRSRSTSSAGAGRRR